MPNDLSLIGHLHLEQALKTIPSGLFMVDMDLRILYWNPAAERITGFAANEALGKHCSFLKGIPCGRKCGLLDPDTSKPIIGVPCSIITKAGERIAIMKNVEMLYNDDGRAIGGIESFHDITLQRQLEKNLRREAFVLEKRVRERTADLEKSESRFRAMLDNMDDFAYITGQDHHLHFMNEAMMEMFGDRVGELCHSALHDNKQPCSWCPMGKVLELGTWREECAFGPRSRTYEIIHSRLPNENGPARKLAICRDITKRKQAELELYEANRELDAFANSISHDLRGILSPVVTYMEFLRMEYGDVLSPEVLEVLGDVERQSDRAINLLDDLLDLAQVGWVEISKQATDVNKVIDEIIKEHRYDTDKAALKTQVAELPVTWVPEAMIYQVFANLINNAIKYAGPAGQSIEIGCRHEPARVVYYVRDHGPGIAPEERETIFNIFARGVNSKGTRGTGVGLAIVRKVALRCQGQTWIEGTPGGGATFCLALPYYPDSGAETGSSP